MQKRKAIGQREMQRSFWLSAVFACGVQRVAIFIRANNSTEKHLKYNEFQPITIGMCF